MRAASPSSLLAPTLLAPALLAPTLRVGLLAAALTLVPLTHAEAQVPTGATSTAGTLAFDPDSFGGFDRGGLHWRHVGPFRGGRSTAATGIPGDPNTYYFGATGGGVWKTTDAGRNWRNVSDGFFGGSIGAVAVSSWDPNVIYVGGGEKSMRGNVSHGSGMWKSTDAGATWTSIGLTDAHHIPRVRIHPRNPDLVYAALLGRLYGSSDTRGVYRSKDGGTTWQRILFSNADAGAYELVMDPNNPRRLFATFWRVRRTPFSLSSGGEGSGIWRSTDGGDTWEELSSNKGLPEEPLGIIGLDVSPADPNVVYAIVEAGEGGLYRSDDGGDTWRRTSDSASIRQRAWYFSRVAADPHDPNTIWVLNVQLHVSRDGGRSFRTVSTPHGDYHDHWIAPEDPRRMISANDGGACISFDGGATWSTQENQPTVQFYRLHVDNQVPYRLYGAQQDNSTLRIASRGRGAGITRQDWQITAGGESGFVVPDPDDAEVVYGGSYGGFLSRLDHRTGHEQVISVWPENPMGAAAGDLTYRFQWNFPIFFSPHDADKLYAAANVLFMSTDEGRSWSAVSPDLTRADPATLGASGGPITKDNTSVEYYGTIFAALESPHEAGVLWTGSDDGLLQVSRDFGATWNDVTPANLLPRNVMINSLESHPSESGGLYVAATAYKSNDFRPYLLKTTDYGATWTTITRGIPDDHFTRVIRADPERPGLLFAGTEAGVYVSFDDGARWQSLQLDLPIVPITDMAVTSAPGQNGDLVVATQGRGFWILDDLSPLRQLTPAVLAKDVHLFTPRPALRWIAPGSPTPDGSARGENGPAGAEIHFYLSQTALESGADGTTPEVRIEILEGNGTVVHSFSSVEAERDESVTPSIPDPGQPPLVPTEPGLNRFVWDLHYPGYALLPGMVLWGAETAGPMALPGDYLVRLSVGETSTTAQLRIDPDPRLDVTPEALRDQFAFLIEVRDKLDETHDAIAHLRATREQIDGLLGRLDSEGAGPDAGTLQGLRASGETLVERLSAIEEALYQTQNRSVQDPLNYPIRLTNKLASLASGVARGHHRPTAQAVLVKDRLSTAIQAQLNALQQVLDTDLPAFNQQIRDARVPAILSTSR